METTQNLLGTRYRKMPSSVTTWWNLPPNPNLTYEEVLRSLTEAPVFPDSTLQLYIHVPYCALTCRFCCFSGANHNKLRTIDRFSRLVVEQLKEMVNATKMRGRHVRSVYVGGGSPDHLGKEIGYILGEVRKLPGVDDRTEVTVEANYSTVSDEFLDELIRHNVTKFSCGVQSLDPKVREYMRLPRNLSKLWDIFNRLHGRIPLIDGDLLNGLPGQDRRICLSDLTQMMEHPAINCVSSYLYIPTGAPGVVAACATGELPPTPTQEEIALTRLLVFSQFQRRGWVRQGIETYMNPDRVAPELMERCPGNEGIGSRRYEDFLLAAGPMATSYVPGGRLENTNNLELWFSEMEKGRHPFFLPKSTPGHQKDMTLWAFPLDKTGLPKKQYERICEPGVCSEHQLRTFHEFVDEGLIVERPNGDGYELSILGQVFKGSMVADMKNPASRATLDAQIAEGFELAKAIAAGLLKDGNAVNDRQAADKALRTVQS
ncbi:radical SAM protein [Cystobacter ferrugineus]|uniref:Radical SAM core domain-containing protein n=1 Tax=Cystobacter ferrugineus TaxID=83449 RepID=A0A1L9AWJ6_9BACT|nr:radical SAM protein [Cystobacter ferrugineus]OJH34293.1 hypothetical protein BON30_44060 [Cystobacter ferrugineus]